VTFEPSAEPKNGFYTFGNSASINYRCFTCGGEMPATEADEGECKTCREFRERSR